MSHVKAKGSARMFQNPVLELLTRTHPLVILGMYVPFCVYLLWYFHTSVTPSIYLLAGVFLAGMFSWTFFEYILHRYVFHLAGDSDLSKRFTYIVHGAHHEYPRDKQRLVMPPVPSILISGTFFLFFRLILGSFVFAFFAGFLIGYLIYAFIHYSTHAFRPPHNAARVLWIYHSLHHYKYPDKAFGVSSPLWDFVFRTMPPVSEWHAKSKVKSSGTGH